MVVGDLHGNLHTFSWVLKLADLAKHPKRHLVLQELVHEHVASTPTTARSTSRTGSWTWSPRSSASIPTAST